MPSNRAARLGAQLRGGLLTVAAAGGALCLLAVGAALVLDVSMIMFRTGSMAPSIPTGSLAVVREVPAKEVGVGDVVTVDRPGRLPVTHRVVEVTAHDEVDDEVTLRLQGDANPAPDADTYTVHRVKEVLWSAPGLGRVVARLQQPVVLGVTTMAVTALVTWVLWPRTTARTENLQPAGGHQ